MMKISKDKRNIRYEYELDKLKKKKKDNILILNIINNKINYICYILKSDYRNILNDINYENKNSIETCFYYSKSYITFLLLYYPYIHNYIKCLRNNNLRIYKNFYKHILKLPNNFYTLIFKLKILDIIKENKCSLNSSNDINYINKNIQEFSSNNISNTFFENTNKTYSSNSYIDNNAGGVAAFHKNYSSSSQLVLNTPNFYDNFSKNNFIKILFSRIYKKKYHKSIIKILELVLFYHSLPSFSFSQNFFQKYHNNKRNSGLDRKQCKSNKNKHFKKLYFKTPFFKHVIVPTIYLNEDCKNVEVLAKKKLVKIKKKKIKNKKIKNKIKKNVAAKVEEENADYSLSENTGSDITEKSLSCLSNSEDEREVNEFLKKEFNYDINLNKNNESHDNIYFNNYNDQSEEIIPNDKNINDGQMNTSSVLSSTLNNENICTNKINIQNEYYKNENNNELNFSEHVVNNGENISSTREINNLQVNDISDNFLKFIYNYNKNNKSLKNAELIYGKYILDDIQSFILYRKNKEFNSNTKDNNNEKKKIYIHEIWKDLINFDDADDNKNTLIHKACLVSNINIIFILLNLNVNLIAYNDKSELPLHCTIYGTNKYIFLLLLHNTIEYIFFYYIQLFKDKNNEKKKKSINSQNIKKEAKTYTLNNYNSIININNEKKENHQNTIKNINEISDSSIPHHTCDKTDIISDDVENDKSVIRNSHIKNKQKYIYYIKNNFFYCKKINHKFICTVVKLYLSLFVKIIELGNYEFLKIMFNYNKQIFCYILQNQEMLYFLCSFARMYNSLNLFIKFCNDIFSFDIVKENKKNPKKRSNTEAAFIEKEINNNIKKIKSNITVDIDNIETENIVNHEEEALSKNESNELDSVSVKINEEENKNSIIKISQNSEKKKNDFINNYVIKKKTDKKNRIEIFYSHECAKHIFVPEPTDYPYMRNRIKNSIPENSTRLDVLISNKHGILKLNTFVNFKIKKIQRKATALDVLRVHDVSYIKMLLQKMKKLNYYNTNDKFDNFLEPSKKNIKNYLVLPEYYSESPNNDNIPDHIKMLKNNNIISSMYEGNPNSSTQHGDNNNPQFDSVGEDCENKKSGYNGGYGRELDSGINSSNNITEGKISSYNSSNVTTIQSPEKKMISKKYSSNNSIFKEKYDKLVLIDNDTFVNKHSFNCALNASGVVLNAVDYISSKNSKKNKKKIFCVVRPPGHHLGTFGAAQFNLSDEDKAAGSQGFCLLNNIAIGISYAKYKYEKYERIAIIDFDVHHGNGTEQIIRNIGLKKIKINDYIDIYSWKGWKDKNDKKNVFFSSIHAFDGYFYPGTGYDTVELEPYIINVTLKKNMDENDFLQLFHNNILIHLYHFKPDILFLSAGFDGHKLDYVNNGFVKKNTSTYFYLTNLIVSLQNKLHFPIISVLEGGYNTSNDMASVFSLSVLEHALSFYYNDISFLSRKKNKSITNTISKKCARKERKKNVLKFPYICLGKTKMEEMFKNYFAVFKEKTKETANLNLTNKVVEYHKYIKEYDRKENEMKKKMSKFLNKNKLYFQNILNDTNLLSTSINIKLPFESYFYQVLFLLKIKLKKKKCLKKKKQLFSQDVNQYFSILNNPSDIQNLKSVYIQQHPDTKFELNNLWNHLKN
ncbi:histone deacetylase, putative [Plasmodium berghei]|uniref:histone deacetylase n=2 Tax=Plasmodium berghei TaxID=5821 RepID=A0A509AQW9_PLABA|nr:histone deacetylase, putative [Plasmodium berghei ANKA]CXI97416.1 histone deacetylase, putative [Plasmodium berghei]SCL97528.1 histone deacetylase, putative [Plasmodium berghei]SCM16628.1 histone deacetylase, putative [Plasmodium berghei]SCM18425.1 histone deacetylase, putative [Plasmodium berghei]SCN27855.1 histone deacetylase, putative [Plasmodium berghei]|eukprot:XP_034423510.1 histone deacetylase, putative [Plasmodium berghei ANKA]